MKEQFTNHTSRNNPPLRISQCKVIKDLRGFLDLLSKKGAIFPGLPTTSSGFLRTYGFCESLLLDGYSACHFTPYSLLDVSYLEMVVSYYG